MRYSFEKSDKRRHFSPLLNRRTRQGGEKNLNRQEGGNTLLFNKRIENPSRGFQNDTESSHGLIDNDPRVWDTIILKIINDYGYKG